MKRKVIQILTLAVTVWIGSSARADLVSPFPSTVPGITIPNTHMVTAGASPVLRGMRPRSFEEVRQLFDYGIRQILVFRDDVPGEQSVAEELEWLGAVPEMRHFEIPFKWKTIHKFKPACVQTVRALKILRAAATTPASGLFFHCTVGEDRTGYLAGLYRMVFEGRSVEDVFQNDMCAHGYADGGDRDPSVAKPPFVVAIVNRNITRVFLKMKALFDSNRLSPENLDERACGFEPRVYLRKLKQYRCVE